MSAADPVREPLRVRRAGPTTRSSSRPCGCRAARAAGARPSRASSTGSPAPGTRQAHPSWVAEHAGRHAGVLIARVVADLPWPGEPAQRRLETVTLSSRQMRPYDAEVRAALTAALRGWAREAGHTVAA